MPKYDGIIPNVKKLEIFNQLYIQTLKISIGLYTQDNPITFKQVF